MALALFAHLPCALHGCCAVWLAMRYGRSMPGEFSCPQSPNHSCEFLVTFGGLAAPLYDLLYGHLVSASCSPPGCIGGHVYSVAKGSPACLLVLGTIAGGPQHAKHTLCVFLLAYPEMSAPSFSYDPTSHVVLNAVIAVSAAQGAWGWSLEPPSRAPPIPGQSPHCRRHPWWHQFSQSL